MLPESLNHRVRSPVHGLPRRGPVIGQVKHNLRFLAVMNQGAAIHLINVRHFGLSFKNQSAPPGAFYEQIPVMALDDSIQVDGSLIHFTPLRAGVAHTPGRSRRLFIEVVKEVTHPDLKLVFVRLRDVHGAGFIGKFHLA